MAMKQMIRSLTNAAKCPWAIGEGTRVNVLRNMTWRYGSNEVRPQPFPT